MTLREAVRMDNGSSSAGGNTLAARQLPKPDPALNWLDVLAGTWSIEGETKAGPAGRAGKVTSVQTFEWLKGGFCLVHRWDIRFGATSAGWDTNTTGETDTGIQLWWYDAESETFRTQFFNTLGGPAGYEGQARDGILTFTGPARHTLTVNDDGSIAWDWELPGDDSTWSPWMHLTMTKVT